MNRCCLERDEITQHAPTVHTRASRHRRSSREQSDRITVNSQFLVSVFVQNVTYLACFSGGKEIILGENKMSFTFVESVLVNVKA
jgi:hypothetical protein